MDHRLPFTQVELREMWTYSDGATAVKAYWPAGAGSWVLADPGTGNVEDVVAAGEFSRRFRPVDVFGDVPGLPDYLGTVTAPDGTALVDLVLDYNPFMLANGPGRTARPHTLIVPRSQRDGWSSATAAELAARQTAMALVAAWYRSLDGGHVVFCANDSAPNLDYLRDAEAASGSLTGAAITKNPRQDVQHAHLHAFYAEHDAAENHESSALAGYPVIAEGYRAFGAALGGDAVQVEPDSTSLRAAARPWGGSYCSYQPGVEGPCWVMPTLGSAQDEVNRRLARAAGLQAEPDPKLGGAVNLVRPSLADTGRRHAAQRATAGQQASFETFAALGRRLLALDPAQPVRRGPPLNDEHRGLLVEVRVHDLGDVGVEAVTAGFLAERPGSGRPPGDLRVTRPLRFRALDRVDRGAVQREPRIPAQIRTLARVRHRAEGELAVLEGHFDPGDPRRPVGPQRGNRLVPVPVEQPPHPLRELWLRPLDLLPRRHAPNISQASSGILKTWNRTAP
jgi:hypothetical protein